jgi:hypothetical protein
MQCSDLTLPEDLRSQVLIFYFDSSSQSFAVAQCHRAVISTGVVVGVFAVWHSVQILTRPPIRPIQTSFRNFCTLYTRRYLYI